MDENTSLLWSSIALLGWLLDKLEVLLYEIRLMLACGYIRLRT